MNHSYIMKGSLLGTFLIALAINVNAQKITDNELKAHVVAVANPISQLKQLEPISYHYQTEQQKNLKLPLGAQYGFTTKSLATHFPAMVYETATMYPAGKNLFKTAKYDQVKMENLIPVLVAAINEQQAQIDALKLEVAALKGK
jgi:hypothetical protein